MDAFAPTIRTSRLLLRPYAPEDAEELAAAINDPEVGRNTLTIPYPYSRKDAETFLLLTKGRAEARDAVILAITLAESGAIIGSVGLEIARFESAELGYWIAKAHRGAGFATEAARAMLHHGFTELGLHRIYAGRWPWNPASGRILEKIGMTFEGVERGAYIKDGERADSIRYSILKPEYDAMRR